MQTKTNMLFKSVFINLTLALMAVSANAFAGVPQVVVDVCNEYSYTNQKQACFVELANIEYVADGAAAICRQYSYTNQKQACLAQVGNARFIDAVINVCNEYSYTNQKQDCLGQLREVRSLAVLSARVCNEYSYTNQKQACIAELANLRIEDNAGQVCMQYSYTNQKQACLKELGRTDNPENPNALSNQITRRIRMAQSAIDQGSTTQAQEILSQLQVLILENASRIDRP